jgi:hypothetical protein
MEQETTHLSATVYVSVRWCPAFGASLSGFALPRIGFSLAVLASEQEALPNLSSF